ncbi:MAG: hypothetical protein K9K88_03760 [Desulfobacterales bacterium]|nr:hypothetical protein [Desulfobacterales bacterium]
MTILGFSASAVKNGNVDRMVQAVLEKSAESYEFVRLSDLNYSPCRACPHQCAKDNLCTLDDDLKPYYCYTCGFGHQCKAGGFFEQYGEEGIRTLKITPDLFKQWEDFPEIASGIDRLAVKISER